MLSTDEKMTSTFLLDRKLNVRTLTGMYYFVQCAWDQQEAGSITTALLGPY